MLKFCCQQIYSLHATLGATRILLSMIIYVERGFRGKEVKRRPVEIEGILDKTTENSNSAIQRLNSMTV